MGFVGDVIIRATPDKQLQDGRKEWREEQTLPKLKYW